MAQIIDMLCNRIADTLEAKCITAVASSDTSRASVVKAWRFQDNPLDNPVSIWVVGGNPGTLELMDGWVGTNNIEDLGLRVPAGEIGGGHLWWRRGRVKVNCNYVNAKLTEEQAALSAHRVLGRATHWTERTVVSDLEDEFGERAILIYVFASTFFEGGGPENQYFWRGDILWQVLTQRPV